MKRTKIIRMTTVPISLHKLLDGQINYMQNQGFDMVLASAKGQEIAAIEKKTDLLVNILPLTRRITPLSDLKALWSAYKLFRKEKPDIVHTHTPKAGIVGLIAAKLARVPIRMHTIAGLPMVEKKGFKRFILMQTERIGAITATCLYPNSFALRDIVYKDGLAPKHKLEVIANGSTNGIDTNRFNPQKYSEDYKADKRKRLGIASDDVVYSFLGRLVGDKGVNELIEAFERLQNIEKKVKLLLVGSDEPRHDPLHAETSKRIKTNTGIISIGWQDDVRPYLAISDVFVFPSYREGMPNAVLQAGAMGLPQIVTNINGSNEIITHDENGIIIPKKDTQALVQAMQKMLDKSVRDTLSKNARKSIKGRYEQKMVWEALLAEYHRLLGV